MNSKVDLYLLEGCGRCKLHATPQCKVHTWAKELVELRRIVNSCGLTEELKWSMPCYTDGKANIVMITAFKESCVISFFKGALLKDPKKILQTLGENSQSTRVLKFTDVKTILKLEPVIKAYIFEAIEIEKAGLKIESKKVSEYKVPEELTSKFKKMPELKKAFEALTPGRQKGYLLHFSQAKQSATREARIEKYIPLIMKGKGIND